jgi:HEPN domain-containing protein
MTDVSSGEQGGLARLRRLSARVFGFRRAAPPAAPQPTCTWPLEGFFTCGTELLVNQQCLGQSFQTRTPTYELTITLPELDSTNALAPLRRPPWRFNGEGAAAVASVDADWGHLGGMASRKPDGTWTELPAYVRQCIVGARVEAENEEQFRTAVSALAGEIDPWWSSFADWIGVLTAQDHVGLGSRRHSILEYGVQAWSGDESGVRRAGSARLSANVRPYPEVLGRAQLQRAMNLAASGQRPPTEWLFIRDARSLLGSGEFRRAVIDAATAAELTLTALLDRHFAATSTGTKISEALLDRSQTLGGRCKLVNELMPGTLPARFQQEVTEPRNLAAHKGNLLTREAGEAAVAKATELVEVAYPLAGFV